jgi:hypothetical protein
MVPAKVSSGTQRAEKSFYGNPRLFNEQWPGFLTDPNKFFALNVAAQKRLGSTIAQERRAILNGTRRNQNASKDITENDSSIRLPRRQRGKADPGWSPDRGWSLNGPRGRTKLLQKS